MKKIIDIKVSVSKSSAVEAKCDVLVVGVFEDQKTDRICGQLDRKLGGAISKVGQLGDFKGEHATTALVYTTGKLKAQRIMLVGLGKKNDLTADKLRKAASVAALNAVNIKAGYIAVTLGHELQEKIDTQTAAQVITEGLHFGGYRYDEFVSEAEKKRSAVLKASLLESDQRKMSSISKGIKIGSILGSCQNYTRTVANRPGNIINPPELAKEIGKSVV